MSMSIYVHMSACYLATNLLKPIPPYKIIITQPSICSLLCVCAVTRQKARNGIDDSDIIKESNSERPFIEFFLCGESAIYFPYSALSPENLTRRVHTIAAGPSGSMGAFPWALLPPSSLYKLTEVNLENDV